MPNLGQNRRFLEPCDLAIWRMTLKNNRAPLLCYFKLCVSFCSHWWSQTGVPVRKRPIWVNIDDFLEPCDLEKQKASSSILLQALCMISWPLVNSNLSYSPEMLIWVKFDNFKSRVNLKFDGWPLKTIGHLFHSTSSFLHHLVAIGDFKLEIQSGNAIWVKIDDFFSRVTFKFDGWPWKRIGHLFHATSSFMHHFVAIGEFKLELQSGNAQSGSNSTIFRAVYLEIWRMTVTNNRAPLLSNIKLCASFHHDLWIQTGVTVRNRQSWLLTSVTLTFKLWPWPFAGTSLLSLVTTPENSRMIRWWEHSQKGVTDGRTDRQTDRQRDGLNLS